MSDQKIEDLVFRHAPGVEEIGFSLPEFYNASELLYRNLEEGRGNKIAVYADAGNSTYAELCARASQTGNALASLGLERGDRILCFLEDTAAYPSIIMGAIRAGFVPMLINTLSPKDLVQFFLEDSGAKVAIFDARHAAIFDNDTWQGASVKHLVSVGGEAAAVAGNETYHWDTWVAGFSGELSAADTSRDDMCFWMYSSGSTGRPKGIVHLQHDMEYAAASYGKHILNMTEQDICYSVPKIFFAYGLGNSVIFPFSVGASVVLSGQRPVAEAVFGTIEKYRPTLFFGLPTLYNSLLQDQCAESADLSSVRMCLSAAEALSSELAEEWKSRYGLDLIEGLGSTEMTHIYLSNTAEQFKIGSSGKRVPGYETRMTDTEGNEVAPGGDGVLWVRGDSSAPCYWNRPEKTRETMREDGWLWTGDRFYQDDDGFYYFRGRADDLIKVSGQWVYPLEIELCLADHEKVCECAVMGVQMEDRRMTLKAFIVLQESIEPSEELTKEFQAYVKQQLLPYKYPRVIEYFDELPKTGTGKIDRQALKNASNN